MSPGRVRMPFPRPPRPPRSGSRPVGVVLLLSVALGLSPRAAAAQEGVRTGLELRAGAAVSSAFAEGPVAVLRPEGDFGLATLDVGPAILPTLGLTVYRRLTPRLDVEVRGAVGRGSVEGDGPGGTWEGGDVTVWSAVAGLRARLRFGLAVGLGVGRLGYAFDGPFDLGGDAETGLLVAGTLAWRLPLALPVPAGLELEAQRHPMGAAALRGIGGSDGSVRRLAVGVWVRPR